MKISSSHINEKQW